MTVEEEHVYRVSPLGVLVHNIGCIPPVGLPGKPEIKPVPAIGRMKDTLVLANHPGHRILNVSQYGDDVQNVFTKALIEAGDPIYVGSPLKGNQFHPDGSDTKFWIEYKDIIKAGWQHIGDFLVPPHR